MSNSFISSYRLAVLKALPNLQKLDDEIVSPEEVQTALTRGRVLVHPLDMYASPPQSDAVSPEVKLSIKIGLLHSILV